MGLLPKGKTKISGSVLLQTDSGEVELIGMAPEEIRKIRGKDIAMIFQDPMSALHPFYSIGDQLIEAHQAHNEVDKKIKSRKSD